MKRYLVSLVANRQDQAIEGHPVRILTTIRVRRNTYGKQLLVPNNLYLSVYRVLANTSRTTVFAMYSDHHLRESTAFTCHIGCASDTFEYERGRVHRIYQRCP